MNKVTVYDLNRYFNLCGSLFLLQYRDLQNAAKAESCRIYVGCKGPAVFDLPAGQMAFCYIGDFCSDRPLVQPVEWSSGPDDVKECDAVSFLRAHHIPYNINCLNAMTRKAEKYIAETDRELPYVPGFFKNKETGRVDFAANRGIGFVVRDARGHALGIQIRRDRVKKGESRYIWFSSSFARAKDNCEGGASPGSPGGVIFPKPSAKRPAVCITEGRFKAVKIAEKGNIAIYVSGVSTWKKILPILDSIIADRKKVYLLFDSDMLGNAAVYGQLEALAEALKERQLSPVPVMWAIENGKGFDDLVNAHPGGYKSLLRYVNFADFKKKYTEALKDTLSAFNAARIRDIKKKDAQAFAEALQRNMEKIFELKK